MNLLILSDLHLGPNTEERSGLFIEFLRTARQNGDRVIIAGDLFDLWLGWKELTFPFQPGVMEALITERGRGLEIEYVEGNRDYRLKAYKGTLFSDVFPRFLRRKWGNREIHIEHGDLVNRSDHQYRLWRAISRSWPAFLLLDLLPASWMRSLALRIEKGMRKTNLRYKVNYPEEHCKKFYAKQFDSGADVVIVGHFHVRREIEVQAGSRSVLFYNLPGWETGFHYLVIPQSNEKPYFLELGR